jgi:hypothetical protein
MVGHPESGAGTAIYAPAVGFVESVIRHYRQPFSG